MSDETSENNETGSARVNAQDRLAKIQKQQARSNRKGPVIAAVLVGALVLGVAGGGYWLYRSETQPDVAAGTIGKVTTYNNLSQEHITSGYKWEQSPPVGGAHNPAWANCGIYAKTIPNQYAVHSLEHGTVWITYKKSLSASQVNKLKAKANKQQGYMLMSIYEKQSSPIVLSAWGKQLHVNSADDPAVDKFIKDYWKGPQTPEPGASCSGAYDPNTGKIAGGM
ncbi:DUF3105 domain-containing protein [Dermacoccaceae bacterium W4C1]